MHQFKYAYYNIWKRLRKEYRYINIYLHNLQTGKFQTTNTTKIPEYFHQHSRLSLKVLTFLDT